MYVKYVHKASLIAWIRLFRELCCIFNMCFRVNRENMNKMINLHIKGAFWKYLRISRILNVNLDFQMSK